MIRGNGKGEISYILVFVSFSVALDIETNNQTNSLTLEIFNPQAFEAIASSSGGIQTLISYFLLLAKFL